MLYFVFLWATGLPSRIFIRKCCLSYEERCLSCKVVKNWVEKFNNGRSHLENDERDGNRVEIATDAMLW